jgi:hypothetical protein
VGKPRESSSVRGEAQGKQFCSWERLGKAILFVGEPRVLFVVKLRESNSVRGEAQVKQFCSWGKPRVLFVGTPRESNYVRGEAQGKQFCSWVKLLNILQNCKIVKIENQ